MFPSARQLALLSLPVVVVASAITAPAFGASARIGSLQVINNSLLGVDIRNSTITSVDVAPNALGAMDLAANSVGASELAAESVTAADIRTGAVGTLEIVDGSVSNADLGANSVTSSKIADDAVGNSEIADNAVTASRIASNAVGQSEIATNGVDTAEIDANAVTSSELAAGAVTADKLAPVASAALSLTGSDTVADGAALAIGTTGGWSETYDNGGLYDAGLHPAYIVATRAGWYHVSGRIQWGADDDATGPQRRLLSIISGTSTSTDPRVAAREEARYSDDDSAYPQSVDAVVRVSVGDRIWLEASQTNPDGDSLAVSAPDAVDVRGANFRAVWLGA